MSNKDTGHRPYSSTGRPLVRPSRLGAVLETKEDPKRSRKGRSVPSRSAIPANTSGERRKARERSPSPGPSQPKTSSPIRKRRRSSVDSWVLSNSERQEGTTGPNPPIDPAVSPTFTWDYSCEERSQSSGAFSDENGRDSVSTREVSVELSRDCTPQSRSGSRTRGESYGGGQCTPPQAGTQFRYPSIPDEHQGTADISAELQRVVISLLHPFSPAPVDQSVQRILTKQLRQHRAESLGSRADIEEVEAAPIRRLNFIDDGELEAEAERVRDRIREAEERLVEAEARMEAAEEQQRTEARQRQEAIEEAERQREAARLEIVSRRAREAEDRQRREAAEEAEARRATQAQAEADRLAAANQTLPTQPRMEAENRRVLLARAKRATDAWEDEFQHYEFDKLTSEYLRPLITEAGDHKRLLMDVVGAFDAHPAEEDTSELNRIKVNYVTFIRNCVGKMAQDGPQSSGSGPQTTGAQRAPDLPTAQNLKKRRVLKYEADMLTDLDNMLMELTSIGVTMSVNDKDIRRVDEQLKTVSKRAESLIKEASSLCSDAVDAQLEKEAESLDDYIRKVKNLIREKDVEMSEQKARTGNLGTMAARLTDLAPPTFSGEETADFFDFKTKYMEFADSRNYSITEQLRTLKTTCLTGTAALACERMESIEEILSYLKNVYGQPRTLLEAKLKDFQKLGKCPGAPATKKRDWFIKTLNKLEYLEKLSTDHGLLYDLYYSPILTELHQNIPWRSEQDFVQRMSTLDMGDMTKEDVFRETVSFLKELVAETTSNVRYGQLLGLKEVEKNPAGSKPLTAAVKTPRRGYVVNVQGGQGLPPGPPQGWPAGPSPIYVNAKFAEPEERDCKACKGQHTHMFLCKKFQEAGVRERFSITKSARTCMRCLRLDSNLDLMDRQNWWAEHSINCETKWACNLEYCGKNAESKQMHFTMCFKHAKENKARQDEFIATLDKHVVGTSVKFFFCDTLFFPVQDFQDMELPDPDLFHPSVEVLPDIVEPAIFMLQELYTDTGEILSAFYDTGCSTSALSDRAFSILTTINVTKGPTMMGVAGGKMVSIPGGVEKFWLDTTTTNQKAELQGLRMPQITTPFPTWHTEQAVAALQSEWSRLSTPGRPALPEVPKKVGGKAVDIMFGIRYARYFPEMIFSLPCGLSIYKTIFKTPDGSLGILGGPHRSWRNAMDHAELLTPMIFLTNEMRAYRAECNALGARNLEFIHVESSQNMENVDIYNTCSDLRDVLEICRANDVIQAMEEVMVLKQKNSGPPANLTKQKISGPPEFFENKPLEDIMGLHDSQEAWEDIEELLGPPAGKMENVKKSSNEKKLGKTRALDNDGNFCKTNHCLKHELESGWKVPGHWDISHLMFNVRTEADAHENLEDVGSEINYRCLRCRNCADCRKGDFFEKTSLMEEVEQALIESCVWLLADEKKLMSKLPFIKDPATSLKPNKNQALKILESQVKAISKHPQMMADVKKAHDKLLNNGHVVAIKDLEPEVRELVMNAAVSYYIPWSCVTKEGSVSSPYRLVFNASFKTLSGESLNSCLAKGVNKLPKILNLLIKFASNKAAFCADVSMAYNSIKLLPEYYCFQKYLWKANLQVEDEVVEMIVRTIIYGVKNSGNSTTAGFEKTADHCLKLFPEQAEGALVVKDHTYMDDTLKAENSPEDCRRVAKSMEFVLDIGGMTVKDFTFSGCCPSEKVSSDGKSVGTLGYVWWSEEDTTSINIKDLYLGKVKRGKAPPPVEGDVREALQKTFTKRTLTGKVAGVYDPRGLVGAITSRFKLDLAEIVDLKLDWDDNIPAKYLDKWVQNLADIQKLKELRFPRSFVHPDAINNKVRLIVSVDASQSIAVATVHAQSTLPGNRFACRLVAAKTKLVHLATVPRGELRAAVVGATLGHVVKASLGDQVQDTIYVTDSQIVLFWLSQDSRPLQTAVRNSVIEVRRLSDIKKWFHVESAGNVADIGTRFTSVDSIKTGSPWTEGHPWMSKPREEMPLRSIDSILLDQKDLKAAQKELKAADICGFTLPCIKDQVSERYQFSKYIVDPCVFSWEKSVRVLAYIKLFISKLKKKVEQKKVQQNQKPCTGPVTRSRAAKDKAENDPVQNPFKLGEDLDTTVKDFQLKQDEILEAERYFFLKTSRETRHFAKKKEVQDCSTVINGILVYTGRILDGQEIEDVENVMGDVEPLQFVKPLVDRYSPVAYAVAIYTHKKLIHHKNPVIALRESRNICFIMRGRELMNEISGACSHCRRFKQKIIQVEMGKVHPAKLTIGPAFFQCQVDMFGPYLARCEHNCMSSVKVWGVIFKDPASSAIAVYAMPASDAVTFLMAYNRHAFRYGHPKKLFIDCGTQLLKACKNGEINWTDLSKDLNSQYGVEMEFETCPVNAHYMHGNVERSVQEVKRIFDAVFKGHRLQLFAYETAFAYCANELNNLPICLGTKTDNLGTTDIITPNRLLLGRNNRRAPAGFTGIVTKSKLMDQLELVHKSWWNVWLNEKLVDFIPHSTKWSRTTDQVKLDDVVVFIKESDDNELGDTIWRIGMVDELMPTRDGITRRVFVRYKNAGETVYRRTNRSLRDIAIIQREGEVEIIQQLNQAAKEASVGYIMRMDKSDKASTEIRQDYNLEEAAYLDFNLFKCEDCTKREEARATGGYLEELMVLQEGLLNNNQL